MSKEKVNQGETQAISIQDNSSHTPESVEVINDVEGLLVPTKNNKPSVKKVPLDNIKRKNQ